MCELDYAIKLINRPGLRQPSEKPLNWFAALGLLSLWLWSNSFVLKCIVERDTSLLVIEFFFRVSIVVRFSVIVALVSTSGVVFRDRVLINLLVVFPSIPLVVTSIVCGRVVLMRVVLVFVAIVILIVLTFIVSSILGVVVIIILILALSTLIVVHGAIMMAVVS